MNENKQVSERTLQKGGPGPTLPSVTIESLQKAFGAREAMTPDELLAAIGRQPTVSLRTKLAKALKKFGQITSHRVRSSGIRKRVYRAAEFQATESGNVIGTKRFKEQQERERLGRARKLEAQNLIKELARIWSDLKDDDKLRPAERFASIGKAFSYFDARLNRSR